MSYLNQFLFGIYPYVALAVFFVGSLVRFDRDQYTWKSDSSQLLRLGTLRWGSNLFHVGILFLFFGHAAGLLTPHALYEPLITPAQKQLLAIIAGGIAVAAMLGRVGVKVRVDARPKTIFFQKIERLDTSMYLLGWGGGTTDAQGLLDPIVHRPDARTQKGGYNYGKVGDEELDALIDAAGIEMNATKRSELIAQAQRQAQSRYVVLPLHRQMITWASRRNVTPVVMPDNAVRAQWIRFE